MSAVDKVMQSLVHARMLDAVRHLPAPKERINSREADKFNIRGWAVLFEELERVATLELRSQNAEAVMAIMDSLDGRVRSTALLDSLKARLGKDLAEQLLKEVPVFQIEPTATADSINLRLPDGLRDQVREAAQNAEPRPIFMLDFMLNSLLYWVNVQRQCQALLAALVLLP